MEIILAIFLGSLFGFVLQRIGAADPDKILGMLSLKDTHLMRAILTGIGVSSALLFSAAALGFVDSGHFSVKAMYWGVPIGGVLLGFGWALSGFCPGTGVVAAGSGRKDAVFFILGGLLGAGLYSVMYESLSGGWLLTEVLGGKASLVQTSDSVGLVQASWGPLLAVALGIGMVMFAKLLPARLR